MSKKNLVNVSKALNFLRLTPFKEHQLMCVEGLKWQSALKIGNLRMIASATGAEAIFFSTVNQIVRFGRDT